jgi:hypothetical protein
VDARRAAFRARSRPPTWKTVEELSFVPHGRRLYSAAAKYAHVFLDADRFPIYNTLAHPTVRLHLGTRQTRWPAATPPRGWYRGWLEDLDVLRHQASPPCSYRDLDAYLWVRGRYGDKRAGERHDNLAGIFKSPTPAQAKLLAALR